MAERVFRDRAEAGRLLAEAVAERLGPQPAAPLVLALPRGGVPVGFEVAGRLADAGPPMLEPEEAEDQDEREETELPDPAPAPVRGGLGPAACAAKQAPDSSSGC